MGRAFEYRKATKLKRWGHMAKTFTKIGKQIAIAVKAGGPEPENNPTLRAIIANAKRENMPKDNIERAIKNAMGKDQSDYKEVTYEGYGPHGIAIFVETLTDNTTRTVGDEFLHDSVDLLVTHCLLLILENEVHSIALLACWQFVTLIDIEELYLLQEFLLSLTGNLLDL